MNEKNSSSHRPPVILDKSPYLTVENHAVTLPSGTVISDWSWIVVPDYSVIITILDKDTFLCVKQVKYATGKEPVIGPAAGMIEKGENPLDGAKRELLEETGYEAQTWTFMGNSVVDANRGAGNAYLYLAEDLTKVAEPNPGDEDVSLIKLSRREIENLIFTNQLKVLSWQAAFPMALLFIDKKSK